MASKAGLSGLALAYLSIGGILAYSGVENTTVAQSLQAILSGKAPPKGPQDSTLSSTELADISSAGAGPGVAGGLGGSATGAAVAQDALRYKGDIYAWGKADPPDGGSDCSGLVNWVLGHDFNLTLPGGVTNFDGSSHGPVVGQYVIWSGARHVPASQIQPGDLICYPPDVHMGIAISATQMISAQGPQGTPSTQVSNINGWLPYVVVRPNAYESGLQISKTAGSKASGQSGGQGPSSPPPPPSSGGNPPVGNGAGWFVFQPFGGSSTIKNSFIAFEPSQADADSVGQSTGSATVMGPVSKAAAQKELNFLLGKK